MLRRHVPQSWNQLGFVIVACIFFYAAFRVAFPASTSEECTDGAVGFASCSSDLAKAWQWSEKAIACGMQRRNASALVPALKNRWVAIAGDSIGRMLFAALLRLQGGQGDYPIHKAHQDFEYVLPNDLRASFFWAPYARNVTGLMSKWIKQGKRPDFVILSLGLWHMLHVTLPETFSDDLQQLAPSLDALVNVPPSIQGQEGRTEAHLYMCSISEVQHHKLQAEDKRKFMTPAKVEAYNRAVKESGLLKPGGPLRLLDVHTVTAGCGASCSEDGIHYHNVTYDTILQTWANTLPSAGW